MKILELEISRTETTLIYVEVPDDFSGRVPKEEVERMVTSQKYIDWDAFAWEHTLEVEASRTVSEETARGYQIHQLEKTP